MTEIAESIVIPIDKVVALESIGKVENENVNSTAGLLDLLLTC